MPKEQTFREYVLIHDSRQWPRYGLGDFINDMKDDPDFDPQSLDEMEGYLASQGAGEAATEAARYWWRRYEAAC